MSPGSGHMPPNNADAERGLLGAILLQGGGEVMDACLFSRLKPEYFYTIAHQTLFEAMIELHRTGKTVDEITVCDLLHDKGELGRLGGPVFISELMKGMEVTAYAESWIEIIRRKYFLRRIIGTGVKAIEKAHKNQDQVDTLIDEVERDFLDIGRERVVDAGQDAGTLAAEARELLDKLIETRGAVTGVPSGLIKLDELTLGFHPGQMVVVAARPGMGKTTMALNFIEAALFEAKRKQGEANAVLFFSLEMPARELMMRLICARARLDVRKASTGYLPRDHRASFDRAAAEYAGMPLVIDDTGGQTILDIRSKARRHHAKRKLGLVVVDYLQLIVGTDPSVLREQQIAEASRFLKALAKEINAPVVALAQLNRKSEDENRPPRMSDLRESGSIEQDADVVLLISKPPKKGKGAATRDDEEGAEYSPVVERQLIVAKQRNGPVGDISLFFNRPYARFDNPAPARHA